MKILRTFSIDSLLWQQFEKNIPNQQRSQVIESFMRSFVQAQGMGDKEREDLEQEEERLERLAHKSLEDLAIVKMQLADIARKESQERSDKMKQNEMMVKSMIHNGVLHGDD